MVDQECLFDGKTQALEMVMSHGQVIGVAGFALGFDHHEEARLTATALVELLVCRSHQSLIVASRGGKIIEATQSAVSALHKIFEAEFKNISNVVGMSLPWEIVEAMQANRPSQRLGLDATVVIKPLNQSRWSIFHPLVMLQMLVEQHTDEGTFLDVSRLSPAEVQILALVRIGMTNSEIARARGVSPLTVKNQIHSLLIRTDTKSRRQLMLRKVRYIPDPLIINPVSKKLTEAWRTFENPT
jgi:DNA-binding CsgD family transcriptional regulator